MTQSITAHELAGDPKRRRKESRVKLIFMLAGFTSIAIYMWWLTRRDGPTDALGQTTRSERSDPHSGSETN